MKNIVLLVSLLFTISCIVRKGEQKNSNKNVCLFLDSVAFDFQNNDTVSLKSKMNKEVYDIVSKKTRYFQSRERMKSMSRLFFTKKRDIRNDESNILVVLGKHDELHIGTMILIEFTNKKYIIIKFLSRN